MRPGAHWRGSASPQRLPQSGRAGRRLVDPFLTHWLGVGQTMARIEETGLSADWKVLECVDHASFLLSFFDSYADLLPPCRTGFFPIFPLNGNFSQAETTFPFPNPLPQALAPCRMGSIKQLMPFSAPAGVLGSRWEEERTHISREHTGSVVSGLPLTGPRVVAL